ncbi:MAG: glycosyltransferase [Coriobacteriia bacterium]|nr:glycosyltransferase [Coriobacteriia bacterium]
MNRPTSPHEAGVLAGTTICYVSNADFSGWTRTYRQAISLAEAGAHVVFVGWDHLMPRALTDSPYEVVTVPGPKLPIYYASTSRSDAIRYLLNNTVCRFAHGAWNSALETWRYRSARRRFINAIRHTGADFVQAVDLPPLSEASEAARRMGARLIYDSHEYWAGFLKNPVWHAAAGWAEQLLATEGRVITKADLVLAVSDPMGDRISARYGITHPLTILNSPIARVKEVLPTSSPVRLVFHGGLSTDRNIDGLIRAMAHLSGRATLDVHGFNRTTSRGELVELIEELGLTGVVRLHGPFDYWNVIELLREYDVGVMAAKISEENFAVTLPNKVFDYMCAGLAMAMYDSVGVRSILDVVPYGIYLDSTSPETIARDLEPLINDPARIDRLKAAALKASPEYWWPAQGRRLVEEIARLRASD